MAEAAGAAPGAAPGATPDRPPLPWDSARCRRAGLLVLLALTLERLAYYGVTFTLYLYLNKGAEGQSWSSENALTAVLVMSGMAYTLSPVGGWLADSLTGRFKAIVLGYLVYLLGLGLLAALAHHSLGFLGCPLTPDTLGAAPPCAALIYVILFLVAAGVGLIQANLGPFGAEQVRHARLPMMQHFFNVYYWCVNLGSVVGTLTLGWLAQNVNLRGFFVSYSLAGSCLLASLAVFVLGKRNYLLHHPTGSMLSSVLRIVWEGARKSIVRCCLCLRRRLRPREEEEALLPAPLQRLHWLDRAKILFGGSHHDGVVEDVKQLGRVLLVLCCLVPFWLVYFQSQSAFQTQALHLRMTMPLQDSAHRVFTIPVAWLVLCDPFSLLFLVPLVSLLLYPCLERRGLRVPLLVRMAVGMFFSLLAACSAGSLEAVNLQAWRSGDRHVQNVSDTIYNCTSVSVLWQLPQYFLLAVAEVFTGVSSLEFSYVAAPRSLQGIVMGLHWFLIGCGSFLGTFLVSVLGGSWIKPDQRHFEGRLDLYFFVLGALQAACLLLFSLWLTWRWLSTRMLPLFATLQDDADSSASSASGSRDRDADDLEEEPPAAGREVRLPEEQKEGAVHSG